MLSQVDEKYLFAVSDDDDEAAPGAVSSLSSEDGAKSPVDWQAIVHRTAREQLSTAVGSTSGLDDAAKLVKATPSVIAVARGAARWSAQLGVECRAGGSGRERKVWETTFPIFRGAGVGGEPPGVTSLSDALAEALAPRSTRLDGSLPKGATTLVVCIGDPSTCDVLQREAVAAAACEASTRVGTRGSGSMTAHPLLLSLRCVDTHGNVADLLRREQRPCGGDNDGSVTKRLIQRLFDAAHLAAAAQTKPCHIVASLEVASHVREAASRTIHVVRFAADGSSVAAGAAQLDECTHLIRSAFELPGSRTEQTEATARLVEAEAPPIVAVCVGGRHPEQLQFALPALHWAASITDGGRKAVGRLLDGARKTCDRWATKSDGDARQLAEVAADLRPLSVQELAARDPPSPAARSTVSSPGAVEALVARERDLSAQALARAVEETRAQRDAEGALWDLREQLRRAELDRDAAILRASEAGEGTRAEARRRLEAEAAALEAADERLRVERKVDGLASVAVEAAAELQSAAFARDAADAATQAMRSLLEAADEAPPSPLTLERPATPASVQSQDLNLVSDLVSTSISSMERRAQLLEQELERSRQEAEAKARELRDAKSKRDDERKEVDAVLARERARHAAELKGLQAKAQTDLEDSLRTVHASVSRQAEAARAALRDLADERDVVVEERAATVSAAAAERETLRRELATAHDAADRAGRVAEAARADAAAVAYGEKLRASAETEARRARRLEDQGEVDQESIPLDDPPPPPEPHTSREVFALERALKSRESEISELRASSRREAAALWLAVGRAEDALAASSRSLVQHGALVAASWDSDDAGPLPPPPPREHRQPSYDDDSALDSVVSDLDDLDARLARLRGRRSASTEPPVVVETARPPKPPSANPVPKIERTNRDVLDFLETSSGPSRTPKQASPTRRVVPSASVLGEPPRRRRKPMAVGSAPPSAAPGPAPAAPSGLDRARRQKIAKLRRERAELSPAGFAATLRG